MKKKYCVFLLVFFYFLPAFSQTGTDFWLAPPNVTDNHYSSDYDQYYLSITALDSNATVVIEQPANSSFTPITVNIPANTYQRVSLVSYVSMLETKPTNTILNTGLHIYSDNPISVYFEYDNRNNPDILALKGTNALGYEFYIPLHNYAPFYNHTFTDTAYASFDIVATEDSTTVRIYPMRDVNGHSGLQQFTIVLNKGQTYSCAWTGSNYQDPSTHPYGSVVLSDKPIAISIKDDSNHNPSGGCYDLMSDQIIPTNVLGQDYIVVKGQLNGGESIFVTAVDNNTEVYVNGSASPIATLFAGEVYRIDIDGSGNERTYVHLSKPAYVTHVTGFGCEEGIAILPPLNCAGSKSVSFSRSTNEGFFLTILVKNGSQNDFSVSPPDFTIDGSNFEVVPGTNDEWVAAMFDFTSEASVGQAYTITNSSNIFALGLINGGSTSGCRYGYFSEFVAEIIVDAGQDQTICANSVAQLNGSVSGGVTTGIWSTSGSGTFSDPEDLNATYTPSYADIQNGQVTLTLTSTGVCFPHSDQMILYFDPAPTVDAGTDQTVCANNPEVTLNGSVTVATGGIWSGGNGTFSPNNTTLNATYIPSQSEINAGSVTLTLTTTGNGNCNAVSDQMTITITPAPTVDAGTDQSVCANNPEVTLNGSVTVATGGQWTGGSGSYNPGSNALNTVYTPTQAEINSGQVTLVLTSTGNGNCLAVSDSITINFTPAPTVDAGSDQVLCANNADAQLNGSVTVATGGQWTGGLGIFTPDNNTLNAVYHPSSTEIASGQVILYLTSTGNGNCNSEKDSVILSFTPAPTADAGPDQVVCENNPEVQLNGSITIASGGVWSGGNGTFIPDNTTLNATYIPSATEIAVGHVTLTLTTTGNGNCNPVTDNMEIIINPAPIVDAGADIHACTNNPNAQLNGSVVNAGGGIWSGGNGTFSPNNTTLNATYIPTQSEINNGSVKLYLTSTGNGTCLSEKDSVIIYFDPAPIVNAGTDITVCANNAEIHLGGTVSNAAGGQWSGGLGIFNPGNTYLNTTYTPTQGEIASGSLTLTLTSTGNGSCLAVSDDVTITFTPAPTVDAGQDITVCENNPDADLSGTITIAGGGIWSGGTGTFTPSDTSLNTTYHPSASEISNGEVTLILTTTNNGLCLPEYDSIKITINPSPIVNAGQDVYVCVDNMVAQLNGSVSGITNTGEWSTNGTGYFVPNNTTLNAQYVCSSQDSINGEVTLTLTSTNNQECLPVSDSMVVYILPAGTADAGPDVTVCANNAAVQLNGMVGGGATSGIWSTSGSGVFYPSDSVLNATYIPSAGDTAVGNVILTLTANSCNHAEDQMTITITPAPQVDAGEDIITCVDNLDLQLNGNVWGGTNTGIWTTSGTGYFSPNNTTLNAVYHASSQDSIDGNVTLVLTSTNNGDCLVVTDTLEINILPAGIVDAGQDQVLCSNNATIQLNGNISGGASEGQWATSGDGIFVPSDTILNPQYIPGTNDLTAGSVSLVLTATNSCNFAFDVLQVNFTPSPTAFAGNDTSLCANNCTLPLNGEVTVASGGEWSTTGDGTFGSITDLNTVYIPGPQDITNGGTYIILTTTGNGNCMPVSDTMYLSITPAPNVNAGNNQTVCYTANSTQLNGTITGGASTGIWTTLGDGYFTPNDSDLNANYVFGNNDTTIGSVTLILTSTNNGNCLAVTDTITLNFTGETFADAGEDFFVCKLDTNIILNGFVAGGATSGFWQTIDGTGTFEDSTQLNAIYYVTEDDHNNGFVSFVLTADSVGACQPGKDTVTIYFSEPPVVDAGPNIEACLGADTISLGGSTQNTNGIIWQTLGSGTFYPSDTILNNFYIPSSADSVNGQVTIILSSRNSNPCNEVSDTLKIFFVIPVNPDFTHNVACENNVVTLEDNSQIITGSISEYTWQVDGQTNILYGNPVQLIFDSTGIYNVTLTVTSSLGCSYSVTKPITVYPLPNADFSYVSNCYKDSVIFTDLSTVDQGTITEWIWIFGDGDTSYIQNPQHLYSFASNYNVSLQVTSNTGCSSQITQSISVYPLPEADFSFNYNCSNNTVTFHDNSTSPTNNLNSWYWDFGDGNFSNEQNPIHHYSTTNLYNVVLIAGSSPNCVDTVVKEVNVYDITANFTFENKCLYDSIPFTNLTNTYGDPASYYWDFGDGNYSTIENPKHLYNESGTYNVNLSVETSSGCTDTITREIEVYPVPTASFSYEADILQVNEPIEFTSLSSSDVISWLWDFGDNTTSNVENTQHIYNQEGNMNVLLIVTNNYNCVDTAYTTIYIEPEEEILPPKLPNAFSPNGDGKNDIFYPRGGPFSKVDFAIFNRWGTKIFHTTVPGEGWDGTYKGVEQPIGTYVWTIEAETIDGKIYKKTGEVILIR